MAPQDDGCGCLFLTAVLLAVALAATVAGCPGPDAGTEHLGTEEIGGDDSTAVLRTTWRCPEGADSLTVWAEANRGGHFWRDSARKVPCTDGDGDGIAEAVLEVPRPRAEP